MFSTNPLEVKNITIFYNKIQSMLKDCSVPSWDLDGALPVSEKTVTNVIDFYAALDLTLPMPEISPECDGRVCLDWRKNGDVVTLYFDDTDFVSYIIFQQDKHYAQGLLKHSDPHEVDVHVKSILNSI